jgi:hypothetical protein
LFFENLQAQSNNEIAKSVFDLGAFVGDLGSIEDDAARYIFCC